MTQVSAPLDFEAEESGRTIAVYRTWPSNSRNPSAAAARSRVGAISYREHDRTYDGPVLDALSSSQMQDLYDFTVRMANHFGLSLR